MIYLFMVLAFLAISPCAKARKIELGDRQDNFLFSGKKRRLFERKWVHAVIFMSPTCPCSAQHVSYLDELAKKFPKIEFVAINANKSTPLEQAERAYKSQGLELAIADGRDLILADQFGAVKTPHAYVLGEDGEILYEGGVVDSTNPVRATKHFLKDALAAVSEGKLPEISEARALGCYIQR